MLKSRVFGFGLLLILVFFLLVGRLTQLSIYKRTQLLQRANNIRTTQVNLARERGDILDRNGIPFTNVEVKANVVIDPYTFRIKGEDDHETISFLSKVLKTDYDQLRSRLTTMNSIVSFTVKEEDAILIKNRNIEGISIVYSKERYNDPSFASHVLGYLDGEGVNGVSGLEYKLDYFLKGGITKSLGFTKNAKNETLHGLGIRLIETEGGQSASVKTSLDFHLQTAVEDVLDNEVQKNPDIKVAIVVSDVRDGSIVAMSSRPTFNREKIADYLDDPNKPLVNRVTLPYSMGSVFKIIDTAAWLENRGTDPPVDFCSGKIEIAGRTVLCSNTEGHKYINLDRAFTSSCNPFFVRMCINLGYDKVLKMASLLGLGKKTGIEKQGIYESAGSLPSHSEIYNEGDVANLVLGQGKVSATPLQVVSIINSVVNDGIYKKPWILSEVLDSEGKVLSKFSKELDYRVFSEETAKRLRHLMIETVENGTGHLVNVEGGAGGKTGSAESGSGKATHAWFAGFFPAKEPKYSAVVLVENGGHGGQIAGPIFAQVAKKAIKAKHLKVE